jgi:hypothetical protein
MCLYDTEIHMRENNSSRVLCTECRASYFSSQTTSILNIVGRLNIGLNWSVGIPALCKDVNKCSCDKCTGHWNLFRIKIVLIFLLDVKITANYSPQLLFQLFCTGMTPVCLLRGKDRYLNTKCSETCFDQKKDEVIGLWYYIRRTSSFLRVA